MTITRDELKKELVKTIKENIKTNHSRNYAKGISKVGEAVDILLDRIDAKYQKSYNTNLMNEVNSELEDFDNDLSEMLFNWSNVYVATTGSMYIEFFEEQARISDHSSSERERDLKKMITGKVAGKLNIE